MGGGKYRVFIGLYFRQGITSREESVQMGYARFHWGLWVEEKGAPGPGTCYEAVEEDVYANIPGSGGWKFKCRDADHRRSNMLMGLIMIGKLPSGVGPQDVKALLSQIPLPKPEAVPIENCISWTEAAIVALQGRGWVEDATLRKLMDHAHDRATHWVRSGVYPGEQVRENYTSRPM